MNRRDVLKKVGGATVAAGIFGSAEACTASTAMTKAGTEFESAIAKIERAWEMLCEKVVSCCDVDKKWGQRHPLNIWIHGSENEYNVVRGTYPLADVIVGNGKDISSAADSFVKDIERFSSLVDKGQITLESADGLCRSRRLRSSAMYMHCEALWKIKRRFPIVEREHFECGSFGIRSQIRALDAEGHRREFYVVGSGETHSLALKDFRRKSKLMLTEMGC